MVAAVRAISNDFLGPWVALVSKSHWCIFGFRLGSGISLVSITSSFSRRGDAGTGLPPHFGEILEAVSTAEDFTDTLQAMSADDEAVVAVFALPGKDEGDENGGTWNRLCLGWRWDLSIDSATATALLGRNRAGGKSV